MDLATIIGILVAFGLVIAALGGEAVLFLTHPPSSLSWEGPSVRCW